MENTTTPVQPTPVAPQVPVQQAPKKGHKVLWIVLSIVAVIVILVGIGLYMIGSKVSEYVDVKDGQVTVKGENGAAVTYGSGSLPAGWPTDVPQYPGSTVGFSGSANDNNGKPVIAAVFTTKDSMAKVDEFYTKQMLAKGWKPEAEYNAQNKGENSISAAFTKGTRVSLIIIATSKEGTGITIQVAEQQ